MGGAPTPKWDPIGFGNHSHIGKANCPHVPAALTTCEQKLGTSLVPGRPPSTSLSAAFRTAVGRWGLPFEREVELFLPLAKEYGVFCLEFKRGFITAGHTVYFWLTCPCCFCWSMLSTKISAFVASLPKGARADSSHGHLARAQVVSQIFGSRIPLGFSPVRKPLMAQVRLQLGLGSANKKE